MAGHFNDHKVLLGRDNTGVILPDHLFQTRIQATNRDLIQREVLKYHLIIQVIKCFDYINDLFYLTCLLDDLLLSSGYFYGNPINALFSAFRGSKAVNIDSSSGKN